MCTFCFGVPVFEEAGVVAREKLSEAKLESGLVALAAPGLAKEELRNAEVSPCCRLDSLRAPRSVGQNRINQTAHDDVEHLRPFLFEPWRDESNMSER